MLASNDRFGNLIEDINDYKTDPNPMLQWIIQGEIDQISDDLDDIQVPGCLQRAKDYLSDTYFNASLYFDAYWLNDWDQQIIFGQECHPFMIIFDRITTCLRLFEVA